MDTNWPWIHVFNLKADEDDPLATTTAHEAIQRLIQYYSSSPYYHLVQEKVEVISQDVRNYSILFIELESKYKSDVNGYMVAFFFCREEMCRI